MRLFNITHPKYTGTVKVVYGITGQIQKIDFSAAQIPADIIGGLKRAIPVNVAGIEAGEGFGTEAVIVEAAFEMTFDMFWTAYDKKINKLRADNLWRKLSKADQVLAYTGIAAYDKFLKESNWGRAKADPETYLRNRMWENEWK